MRPTRDEFHQPTPRLWQRGPSHPEKRSLLTWPPAGINIPAWMNGWLTVAADDVKAGSGTSAGYAVAAIFAYSLAVCGALLALAASEGGGS